MNCPTCHANMNGLGIGYIYCTRCGHKLSHPPIPKPSMKSYKFSDTSAKLVELIEVKELFGDGTEANPHRQCRLFFDKGGNFVAIDDPHHPHERALYEQSRGM